MTRRLLNLLTAVSLLLCVAVVVLWVRSYWVADEVVRHASRWRDDLHWQGNQYVFTSRKGTWAFAHQKSDYDLSADPPSAAELASFRQQMPDRTRVEHRTHVDSALDRMRMPVNKFGFAWEQRAGSQPDRRIEWRAARMPAYLPFVLTALAPAVWLYRAWSRRRRSGRNLCPSCGYDLRATPGRCPECGTIGAAEPVGGGART